jgi:protein-disulfide isomerase
MRTPFGDYSESAAVLTDPVDLTRDHSIGPPDAPVTLVEYGDYECPYCGRAHAVVRALLRAAGDRLRFVFRHFPLSTVHPHAQLAAEAAEAAGAQGRFWPMHDMLFANQHALDEAHLVAYAGALGLDQKRFVKELVGRMHQRKVREDFLSGVRSGVNGTPTFFINGIRHNGSFDFPILLAAVEAAAEEAGLPSPY